MLNFSVVLRQREEHAVEIHWRTPSQVTANVEINSQDNVDLFDCKGVVRREFFLPGQTVDQKFYEHGLERVRQRMRGAVRNVPRQGDPAP
jgi:hypothetical protein